MPRPKWSVERWLSVITLIGVVGGGLAFAGYELKGPHQMVEEATAQLNEHVEEFSDHLVYHDSTEERRDASRQQRTARIDGISRLLCVKTPRDTLELAGMIEDCAAVGVRK